MKVSKELLSEVLGEDYSPRLVEWTEVVDNYLRTYYDCGNYDEQGRPTGLGYEINIYELSHRCKLYFHDDYIFDEACYDIKVTKIEAFTEPKVVYEECWMDIPYDINQLFKACEWLLENRL